MTDKTMIAMIPGNIDSIEILQVLLTLGETNWIKYGDVYAKTYGDLTIFNYSSKAQYEGRWNWFETVSRGLILNNTTGEVVARPFDKLFNWLERGRRGSGYMVNITDKMDGCFIGSTKLNLWDGGTIKIRDIVNKKLDPVLMGKDEYGDLVPSYIVNRFNNGKKDNWLKITVDCPVSLKSGLGGVGNNIIVTPNHSIYCNGEFISASEIKVGDVLSTQEKIPDNNTLHMIESSLLGDGCITKVHNAYRYQESHKEDHIIYTQKIRQWLGECKTKLRSTVSGFGTEMMWANSKSYKSLIRLRDKWYPYGEKIIPENLDWIDDFTVAKWYMDDGSLSHTEEQQDRAIFSTNSFTQNDVKRLAVKLTEMYKVSCVTQFNKGWTIRINAGKGKEIDTFWNAIAPHIVSCMKYKLPERYRAEDYIEYYTGAEELQLVNAEVLSVNALVDDDSHTYFASGKSGFDIETSTGNYFAKGVLVHNSLGILYRQDGEYKIATRGSLDGEQAKWATRYLNMHFYEVLNDIPDELTLLFEIIYKDNRIVVDYGNTEGLILLAARSRENGEYLPMYPDVFELAEKFGFDLVESVSFNSLVDIITATGEIEADQEGWVVEMSDGSRWKFKGDAYVEVHKAMSNLSVKTMLAAIQNESVGLGYLLIGVPEHILKLPEHIQDEAIVIRDKIIDRHIDISYSVDAAFSEIDADMMTRKEFAMWVNTEHRYLSMYLFALYDDKNIDKLIFKHAFKDWDIDS